VAQAEVGGMGTFPCTFPPCHSGTPALRAAEIYVPATFSGVGLRQKLIYRHVDERWGRCGRRSVGERDFQHLCQKMQRAGRDEAECADVVRFEYIEHLDDVERS